MSLAAAGDLHAGVSSVVRRRLEVRGVVQGVGFRPFVHRLAGELSLAGWVRNDGHGVSIELEGPSEAVESFNSRLRGEAPALATILGIEAIELPVCGERGFAIRSSDGTLAATTLPLTDAATCGDCLREMDDPHDRRFRYPFLNCTQCGPRFSIVLGLPYDRANTTMRAFVLCADCLAEYEDPLDRRFHAQPTACPRCGPRLALWDGQGRTLDEGDDALRQVADALRQGRIVAFKGLGGFQLLVDAGDDDAVRRLRQRKCREDKPLALLYPDIGALSRDCRVDATARELLTSFAAPIVLLDRRPEARVAASVAPGQPRLGAMLPCTPLHHLLMREVGQVLVATSGNRSDEPIVIDEQQALVRLAGIADLFLVHDRPIARAVDDSVVAIVDGAPQVWRRARGYAPLPVAAIPVDSPRILAVGAHLKSSLALTHGGTILTSQHVGDLGTPEAREAFARTTDDLLGLLGRAPAAVACDLHPDYASSVAARKLGPQVIAVQHHHAHVVSAMAEHGLEGEVLGVSWDGAGLGPDGTVWGGEFLRATRQDFTRVGHLRTFPLLGGDAAAREPRRAALGVLWELYGEALWGNERLACVAATSPHERRVLTAMLSRGVSSPRTSSAGRLFDAVAAITGLRQEASFEGQAAMELEAAAWMGSSREPFPAGSSGVQSAAGVVDWGPVIEAVVAESLAGASVAVIAARFHASLVEWIAARVSEVGVSRVVLTGGCFQNRLLSEATAARVRRLGCDVWLHRNVPPNDGGIAVGQVAVALARLAAREESRGCA